MNAFRSKNREYYLAFTSHYGTLPTLVEYQQFVRLQCSRVVPPGTTIEFIYDQMNAAIAEPSSNFGG